MGIEKTVLITGATGFLGSHLVRMMIENGCRVISLKRSFSNLDRLKSHIRDICFYNTDRCSLSSIFAEIGQVDAVIHTATHYGRRQSCVDQIFSANTVFPLSLLSSSVAHSVPLFINTDTSLNRTISAYALSKTQFREWGEYVSRQKKIRFYNIRLEQIIGPEYDNSKFLIRVIEDCLNNVPELALTLGGQKRDFIHIDDVVAAYKILLEKSDLPLDFYQDYELGNGDALSIREYVELVHQMTHSKTRLNFGKIPYRPNEVMYAEADTSKLKLLGWDLQYSNIEGISKTVDWYSLNIVSNEILNDR